MTFLSAIGGNFILQKADIHDTTETIIVGVLALFILSLLFLGWSETRKPLIVINGGNKSFALLAKSPNAEVVESFIKSLQEKIRERIINLRVKPKDAGIPIENKKQILDILLDENILDRERYDEIITEIEKVKNGQT